VAGALNGRGQRALMAGARSAGTTRDHLASLRNEAAYFGYLLVIDVRGLVHAKGANFTPRAAKLVRPAWASWSWWWRHLFPRVSGLGYRVSGLEPDTRFSNSSIHLRTGRCRRRYLWEQESLHRREPRQIRVPRCAQRRFLRNHVRDPGLERCRQSLQ